MQLQSYLKHSVLHNAGHIHDPFTPHTEQTAFTPTYTPVQLAKFYGFPPSTTGAGKNVAVIELGGGYVQSDLDVYFKSLGLTVKPVIYHSIDGAKNAPGDPNGADGEVMLDLCVIGAMAPGAQLHCYMADNSDVGFLAAINQAIDDKMDVISISWGGPEDSWDSTAIQNFNVSFQKAAALGITVTAAAGDNGSGDGEAGNHVDFPASSPFVTACGGTSVSSVSPISEKVWNDGSQGGATGGGVSSLFTVPSWQVKANVPGGKFRGVPDVAGNADPETGWIVIVDGQRLVIGGTSAVAPMWAALSACLSQALGRNVGFLNPVLYSIAGWYRDITLGNNGTYTARAGYDCCTGVGVPVGTKLLAALTQPVPTPTPVPVPPTPTPAPVPTKTVQLTIGAAGAVITVTGDVTVKS